MTDERYRRVDPDVKAMRWVWISSLEGLRVRKGIEQQVDAQTLKRCGIALSRVTLVRERALQPLDRALRISTTTRMWG